MAEDHLRGISHLGSDRIFILCESVEVGAKRVAQSIMRSGSYARFFSDLCQSFSVVINGL